MCEEQRELHATIVIPSNTPPKEILDGTYTPWVVLSEIEADLTNAILNTRFQDWIAYSADDPDDFSEFMTFLEEECGYVVPYLNRLNIDTGICVIDIGEEGD